MKYLLSNIKIYIFNPYFIKNELLFIFNKLVLISYI